MDIYILTLKQFSQGWRVIAHIRGRGYDISYLYAAPVTGRGLVNIIAGWQVRETRSDLAIYEWTQNGVREITRPGIYFSGIEVEDMPVLDGQYEIALWSRENEEMYQVGVYRWRNSSLELAADLYPYYLNKVAGYHHERTQEIPDQDFPSIDTATSITAPPLLKEELLQPRKELPNMRAAYLYCASIQTTQGEKWGYIDDGGRFILPPQYDDASRFQANGLAAVRIGDVFGVIDASGAAHGMPTNVYAHIDLEDGTFYRLQDLFIKDSDYVKVLSGIIKQQIETESQYSYVFPDAYKGIQADQPFYVTDTALYIYFTPYEIAPFVAGFPTFVIPYIRIRDILDTQGKLWRAFH